MLWKPDLSHSSGSVGTDDECEPIDDVDDEQYNDNACHSNANANNDIDIESDDRHVLPVKFIISFSFHLLWTMHGITPSSCWFC